MKNKQTAVEWLDSNLIHSPYSQEDFTHNYRVFEQAKAMEKEQIKDAFSDGEHQQGFELKADYYYQNIYGTDQGIEKTTN
jgi:hypothetical protein